MRHSYVLSAITATMVGMADLGHASDNCFNNINETFSHLSYGPETGVQRYCRNVLMNRDTERSPILINKLKDCRDNFELQKACSSYYEKDYTVPSIRTKEKWLYPKCKQHTCYRSIERFLGRKSFQFCKKKLDAAQQKRFNSSIALGCDDSGDVIEESCECILQAGEINRSPVLPFRLQGASFSSNADAINMSMPESESSRCGNNNCYSAIVGNLVRGYTISELCDAYLMKDELPGLDEFGSYTNYRQKVSSQCTAGTAQSILGACLCVHPTLEYKFDQCRENMCYLTIIKELKEKSLGFFLQSDSIKSIRAYDFPSPEGKTNILNACTAELLDARECFFEEARKTKIPKSSS